MKILATILLGPGSEASVGDAIRSAASSVDGFILIESGGGNDAIEAALDAAKGAPCTIHEYRWDGDYGAARNAALNWARHAEGGCDYALTLDPDERLVLRRQLRDDIALNPEAEVFLMQDRDEGYCKERVLRCASDLSWHGRVCEFMVGMTVPQVRLGGVFWELPKDEAAHRRRWERGVIECRRMIDGGDDRYRWRRHLGSCLMGLERRAEAVEHYRAALELTDVPEETAWMRYLLAEQSVLDGDFEKAKSEAAVALADHAGFIPEFGWIMGYCELKLGNHQNASRWAQLASSAPPDRTRVGFRSQRVKPGCQQIIGYLHGPGAEERRDGDFTVADFARRRAMRPNYQKLTAAVVDTLKPESHLDLGAGQGLLVEAMHDRDIRTRGVELEEAARPATRADIQQFIRYGLGVEMWAGQDPADLVSCVEVLEHVPESDADKAVAAICGRSTRWVYFSAAAPGQAGKGHVNCQPKPYWRTKFEAHGFRFAEQETSALVARIKDMQPCWWLPKNAMIFKRESAEV